MLNENVTGFEDIYLSSIAPFMGVRESRRIIGKQMIREEAALNAEVPEDTIALGSYIIDIHSGKDDSTIIRSLKRSEEHTSELQSRFDLVCRPLLEENRGVQ